MIERRNEQRRRSLLGAQISFNRRQSSMDCVVRNIGERGAMVEFPHTALVPTEFTLHIPHREETHTARVVWRRRERVGVSLSQMERIEVPIEHAKRIRQLEGENRRLRKQLDPGAW